MEDSQRLPFEWDIRPLSYEEQLKFVVLSVFDRADYDMCEFYVRKYMTRCTLPKDHYGDHIGHGVTEIISHSTNVADPFRAF